MRMLLLIASGIMFLMFMMVAVLAFKEGDMYGTKAGLAISAFAAAVFVFEWVQRRIERR